MKSILTAFFFIITHLTFAQSFDETQHTFRISPSFPKLFLPHFGFTSSISPNVGAEWNVGKYRSISTEVGADLYEVVDGGWGSHRGIYPFAKVEARKYWNIEKREAAGKNTAKFSGSYFGAYLRGGKVLSYYKPELGLTLMPVVGLQRSFWNFGYFQLYTGLGASLTTYTRIENSVEVSSLKVLPGLDIGINWGLGW